MNEAISEFTTVGGFALAKMRGDIDLTNASEIGEFLLEETPRTAPGLILGLQDVQYMDSAGIRMLFDLVRQLETRRQRVGAVVPQGSHLRSLLKITNAHEAVALAESVEECVASLLIAGENAIG